MAAEFSLLRGLLKEAVKAILEVHFDSITINLLLALISGPHCGKESYTV